MLILPPAGSLATFCRGHGPDPFCLLSNISYGPLLAGCFMVVRLWIYEWLFFG